jgi:hypothetical protein
MREYLALLYNVVYVAITAREAGAYSLIIDFSAGTKRPQTDPIRTTIPLEGWRKYIDAQIRKQRLPREFLMTKLTSDIFFVLF